MRGKVVEGIEFSENPFDSLEGSHALLIATEWDLFRQLDKEKNEGAYGSAERYRREEHLFCRGVC